MVPISMDNPAYSFEYSLTEQQPNANNQQEQNANRNQSNALSLITVTNKTKKTAMTPTPLYTTLFSSKLVMPYEILSLGNIHVGQHIHFQQPLVHLLCSYF
ncbi:unnamed protein product [Rotaria socialis]|nr:unnamed protein product [Rotaria socialis]CAF4732514.1 unnamed protein product [Rotaria socialis]